MNLIDSVKLLVVFRREFVGVVVEIRFNKNLTEYESGRFGSTLRLFELVLAYLLWRLVLLR